MNKLFLCLLFAWMGLSAQAQVRPHLQWKMATSEHFYLIYDAEQQELAELYLARMEAARSKLSRLWSVMPEKLTVIMSDRTDLTNGYATALPYAHVMLFPTLPGPMESISELGDWAEAIFLHELTHVLSFEQRRGVVRGLSMVFGNIITPNILLPRWWLEGVAVDAETRLLSQGRLRSNFQDATLRALVSSSQWQEFELANVNEFDIPTWPYGARPYIFGSLIWSEMIALQGERMINDLHVAYGGRVPFALTAPIEERFGGDDLPVLFEKTKRSVAERVEKQKQTLSKSNLTRAEIWRDRDFLETFTPRLSPDGLKMAFLAKDDTLKRSIQILIRPNTQVPFSPEHRRKMFGQKEEVTTPSVDVKLPRAQDGPPGGTINRVSWKKDSDAFVFDLIREKDRFQDISDLWIFSLTTGKATKLTQELRAREPDVSPDGTRVAFIKIEAGRTSLGVFDFATNKSEIVHSPPMLSRLAWPVWLDDKKILVSLRDTKSERFLVVDTESKTVEAKMLNAGDVSLPLVTQNQILFIGNANGVRNIYSADLALSSARPITHLWTGAYAMEYDAFTQDLWFTQIGENGFELAKLPRKHWRNEPATLPQIEPLLADRYPAQEPATPVPLAKSAFRVEDYSPWWYLLPRYWLPFVYFDDKGMQVSATTSAFDPLQKHAYSLFGSYDSYTKKSSYAVRYVNQSLTPALVFQTSKLSSYLADPEQKTTTESSQVSIAHQLAGLSPDLYILGGWSWLAREQFSVRTYQTGPSIGLSYADLSQSGDQISPEAGGTASVTSTHFLKADNREHYTLTSLAAAKYGKLPWLRHHAWMARVSGQYVDRDISVSNYDATLSSTTSLPPGTQAYLMRGYVTGAFLGKSIINGSLEYRFPMFRIDRGSDYAPIFFKRISGAIVTDVIGLEGYQYDVTREPKLYRRVTSWQAFGNAGAEVKLDVTLGYHLEFQIILGAYQPFGSDYAESSPRWGLALSL